MLGIKHYGYETVYGNILPSAEMRRVQETRIGTLDALFRPSNLGRGEDGKSHAESFQRERELSLHRLLGHAVPGYDSSNFAVL